NHNTTSLTPARTITRTSETADPDIYTRYLHDALPILMLDELCDVRAHGLTEEEFVRSRDQLKGSYALANESTGARMNAIGKSKLDRKSTRLNSSHVSISYAVFCLKKKTDQKAAYAKAA